MSGVLLRPIIGEPVLKIETDGKKILCIADLHLGLEVTFIEKGIGLTPQNEKILEKTISLIKREEPHELILLGDVKHNIPLNTVIEAVGVPRFLSELKKNVQVTIVPGNHDTGLKALLTKGINLEKASGTIRGTDTKIGFIHGHKKPKIDLLNCEIIVLAHTHPAIKFIDSLYNSFKEPVWVVNEIKTENLIKLYSKEKLSIIKNKQVKVIVMPAYSPLISGSPINVDRKDPLLGPLLKSSVMNIETSEIYLIDGTYLGKLSDIASVEDFYFEDKIKRSKKVTYF
jgi:putative SbcD/Mre11-related phosphoesterase